ncbi:MAG: hypothetical protein QHJ34_14795 [bacterium]|jgi:hypothetical protein|nr:hypothetical protein [candidate division KSB1 bacterium]MDH7561469.1 hypothetical protein [bacterium]
MHKERAIVLTLIALLVLPGCGHTQELMEIQLQLDSLLAVKTRLESALDSVNHKIGELDAIKLRVRSDNDTTSGVLLRLTADANMRNRPDPLGDVVRHLAKDTEVLVVGYSSGYCRVVVGNEIGYINEMFLPKSPLLSGMARYGEWKRPVKAGATQPTGAETCGASRRSTLSDTAIHMGPRGGRYHINAKGNKVYVPRKKK